MIRYLTNLTRQYLTCNKQSFRFKKSSGNIMGICDNQIDLYIHIPFCKSLCPYCPYNKIVYNKRCIPDYIAALQSEINLYKQKFQNLEIGSIYIGGGTPTLLSKELFTILQNLKRSFRVNGPIAIETNPYDISKERIEDLENLGITSVSLGAQSFKDKFLKILQRNYSSRDVYKSIELLQKSKI